MKNMRICYIDMIGDVGNVRGDGAAAAVVEVNNLEDLKL